MIGWQPIETAPKDGTRILLVAVPYEAPEAAVLPASVHIGYWNPEGTAWVDECDSLDGDAHHLKVTGVWNNRSGWFQPNEVSHWMPLPEPPFPAGSKVDIVFEDLPRDTDNVITASPEAKTE